MAKTFVTGERAVEPLNEDVMVVMVVVTTVVCVVAVIVPCTILFVDTVHIDPVNVSCDRESAHMMTLSSKSLSISSTLLFKYCCSCRVHCLSIQWKSLAILRVSQT
ncbi:unnamed protein product [Scytosiphon promiscuus]